MHCLKRVSFAFSAVVIGACTIVGPDYVRPDSPLGPDWYEADYKRYDTKAEQQVLWWQALGDPVLDELIELAHRQNNSLKIAGLRVLESRAQLGIAIGNQYPQTQAVAGGKFKRGIKAADAAYLASIAGYDQVMVLVTAQVCGTYLAIRTLEEQLRITNENIVLQQRSFDIVNVQFQNGSSSELDVLQARTLLMSTKASIPELQTQLRQAMNALSTLLGRPTGDLGDLLKSSAAIPKVPQTLAVGLPADLLRRRPDVRQAEYLAMAQNARVGLAQANLYPSFSLTGSIGLTAAGNTETTRTGESGFGQLFDTDSIGYAVGPSFVWPFLNYDRIKNSVRVQDARLQQSLIAYRETALQAAREVEDALASLDGAIQQEAMLAVTVGSARRSTEVAQLRFNEGFADYQRVLSAQQALFSQQARYVSNRSSIVSSFIALYLALGGGWENRADADMIDAETRDALIERTNWGDLIE